MKSKKDRLINFKNKSKEQYDSKSHSNLLNVGEKVYLESKAVQNKLTPKWQGSSDILKILLNGVNVAIIQKGKRKIVHKKIKTIFFIIYRPIVAADGYRLEPAETF